MLAFSYFICAGRKKWFILKVIMVMSGVLLLFFTVSAISGKTMPSTKPQYVCAAGKCTQMKYSASKISPPANSTFDSIEVCRISCQNQGTLWPLPTLLTDSSQKVIEINLNKIEAKYNTPNSDTQYFLQNSVNIFKKTLISECRNSPLTKPDVTLYIDISVISTNLHLDLNSDETYKLKVVSKNEIVNAEINATSVYGARHALETLSQLTARRTSDGHCSVMMIDSATIKDRPIFKYRGLLIDTSRNYLPIASIKRVLDAMSAVKLNVLHWHIVDSHSFPLLLNKLPLMAKYGAYSPEETYSTHDIKHLINYAKDRGIRILLEIDAPAHAGNGWEFGEKTGLGKLSLCVNSEPWMEFCLQPPCGQLNVANPNLYEVLHDIYQELQSIIPVKDIFHMGGDEVHFHCWNSSQEILEYMDELGLSRTKDGFISLWAEFQKKALEEWDRAVGHSKTMQILWSSDLTNAKTIEKYLDKNRYIIETWTGRYDFLPESLMAKGYNVIFATRDAWYLDHGFWGFTTYHTWKVIYDYLIPEDSKVLGGEVALWGELVDADNLENKLWPRAAAFAERLWSSPRLTSSQVTSRFFETRQRLRRRGHKVDQIIPEWCYLNDGKCPEI